MRCVDSVWQAVEARLPDDRVKEGGELERGKDGDDERLLDDAPGELSTSLSVLTRKVWPASIELRFSALIAVNKTAA